MNSNSFKVPLRIWGAVRSRIIVDGFDFAFLILLLLSTFAYHQNARHWSGHALIGNWQYGDAEFWWSGAIQFGEGILRENPNLTYRMGYAVVGGLWVALFGANFYLFHTFLLICYLVAWYALYLTLRPSLGKIAAATGILLMVLNPFTAEWLAISTSDSVGLLFNTWALVFLLVGLRKGAAPAWLAATGLLVAFSSLTRPLMTPFLGPALLLPLLAIHVDWRRRLRAVAALLAAFAVPTLVWIAILRSYTGEWKLAGSDATTFYAASDPQIQVWNNEMYAKVESSAKIRLNGTAPTAKDLNQEFWRLTLENYSRSAGYHLRRIRPHVVEIAHMSIAKASLADADAKLLRLLVLSAFALVLAISVFRRGATAQGLLALAIVAAWMFLSLTAAVVLLAFLCVVPLSLWNRSGWGGAVLTAYWCAGVAALYLVGGTWGPPLGPTTSINSLGYRLGTQFFFAADLMVLCLIHNVCIFRNPRAAAPEAFPSVFRGDFWNKPVRWASVIVSSAFLVWLGLLCAQVTAGAAVVTHKLVNRSTGASRPYPDVSPVVQMYLERRRKLQPVPNLRKGIEEANALLRPNENSPDVLATGTSTEFIWNLVGQDRTKMLICLQSRASPLDFTNRLFVDVPSAIDESEWSRRQGAWLLRRFQDNVASSNLPWYVSDIAVRAFVPLRSDGKGFELAKTRWLPVVKYATQLHSASELIVEGGAIEFSGTSGVQKYPRRFALRPGAGPRAKAPVLVIDTGKALNAKTLVFGWQCELTPGEFPRTLSVRIQRYTGKDTAGATPLETVDELTADFLDPPLRTVNVDLSSPPTSRVRLEFTGLRSGETAWVYEFNLSAEDWTW